MGKVSAQRRGRLLPAWKQGPGLAPWDLLNSPLSFLQKRWHCPKGMNGNFLLPGPSQRALGWLRLEKLNQRARIGQGVPQALISADCFQHVAFGSAEICVHCGRSVWLLPPRR